MSTPQKQPQKRHPVEWRERRYPGNSQLPYGGQEYHPQVEASSYFTVEKPGALRFSRSVGVTIIRTPGDFIS